MALIRREAQACSASRLHPPPTLTPPHPTPALVPSSGVCLRSAGELLVAHANVEHRLGYKEERKGIGGQIGVLWVDNEPQE